MALDAFLEIEGIPGESTDSSHTNWIELYSFSHGLSQSVGSSVSTSGARTAERCDHQDFTIMKGVDKASPELALHCCNGKHIPKVTMEVCRATGDKQLYLKYILEDVLITSYQPSGQKGGEVPTESVSFNYAKITWEYTPTDPSTGAPGGAIAKHWNQTDNTGG